VIPWRQISDFRNVLAHGHTDIRLDRVWEAVSADLTPLKDVVDMVLRVTCASSMTAMRAQDVVLQFNAYINSRDVEGLGSLMTDDHEFIDSADTSERGQAHCLELWRGFFQQFPDYLNTFTEVRSRGDFVVVVGYSSCSYKLLDGPALWTARINDGKVAQWRVYIDTPQVRASLGIE